MRLSSDRLRFIMGTLTHKTAHFLVNRGPDNLANCWSLILREWTIWCVLLIEMKSSPQVSIGFPQPEFSNIDITTHSVANKVFSWVFTICDIHIHLYLYLISIHLFAFLNNGGNMYEMCPFVVDNASINHIMETTYNVVVVIWGNGIVNIVSDASSSDLCSWWVLWCITVTWNHIRACLISYQIFLDLLYVKKWMKRPRRLLCVMYQSMV